MERNEIADVEFIEAWCLDQEGYKNALPENRVEDAKDEDEIEDSFLCWLYS